MRNKRNKLTSDTVFTVVNGFLLIVITLIIIYPLYFTVIASFSDAKMVATGQVTYRILGFNVDAYSNIMMNKDIWIGYRNSFFYTILGTFYNLAMTMPCAYAMSKQGLKGRNIIMGLFVFTMYFSGGMIPSYLLIDKLNLINTPWVMIIPTGFSVYNMIVSRTFYQTSISEEIYEAAKIDGSSELGIFFRIALPLSGPIIAVMALFYAVGHWNSFFTALIYIDDRNLYPLQLVLRNILLLNQTLMMNFDKMTTEELSNAVKMAYMAESMKYSLIFISSLPVLVAYPFVQKFFVKGVMVGSVKG